MAPAVARAQDVGAVMMMRFIYFMACTEVAINCVSKAFGIEKSVVFSTEYLWLYWGLATLWMIYGIAAFFWRPE